MDLHCTAIKKWTRNTDVYVPPNHSSGYTKGKEGNDNIYIICKLKYT